MPIILSLLNLLQLITCFGKPKLFLFFVAKDLWVLLMEVAHVLQKKIGIEGTTQFQPNLEHRALVDQDQTLLSMLVSSLSEEVLPIIVGLDTSREVWYALESTLASPSTTRKLNLPLQLQSL